MTQNALVREVTTLSQNITEEAKCIIITDRKAYLRAGELIILIKQLRKKISSVFKPIKQRIDEAKKEVLTQERAADKPLAEAEELLCPRIIAYEKALEQIRLTEEARLQHEAREQDEERRLMEAIRAQQAGEDALALSILDEPVCPGPVLLARTFPRVPGLSVRKNWNSRITNPELIPREYLMPDLVKIGRVVRALKNECHIPGIQVYEEDTLQSR